MHIVQVTPDFPPECGGIGSYVYYLARELISHGHTVSVVFRGKWTRSYVHHGIPVREVAVRGYPPFNNGVFRRVLAGLVEREVPDILHLHSATMPAMSCVCPVVVTSHWCTKEGTRRFYRPIRNLDELYRNIALPAYVRVESRLVHHCDRLTVVSESLQREYLSHYGVKSDVILNGVDPSVFSPACPDRKGNAVLFTGRLRRGKGILDLLDVAELLHMSHPGTDVLIIGRGSLHANIVKEVRTRGLCNVKLIEHLPHDKLVQHYARSCTFVLPSYYEGLPTCILEAMASGLPVVASDVSGAPELVADGVNGYLVPLGRVEGFHRRISELLDDEGKRTRFGEVGREIVLSKFTWTHIGRRVLDIYTELLNCRRSKGVHHSGATARSCVS